MMSTTTQEAAPLSRFSRFTFGLGLKANASSGRARDSEPDDQWYIPYSGPVEPPREPLRRLRNRDSWGDPIERDEEEDDTALASVELHKRYVGSDSQHSLAVETSVHIGGGNGFMGAHRARVQSAVSGRTVSSGVVDPSRASIVTQRRSTITSSHRLPAPLPASGGVGESPMPPTHRRNTSKDGNRNSLAGFFSFGSQARNRTPSEKGPRLTSKKLATSGQAPPSMGFTTGHRRSSSTGSNSLMGHSHEVAGTDEYYHSYYFSSSASEHDRSYEVSGKPHPYGTAAAVTHLEEEMSPSSTSGSDARHPYTYVFPTASLDDSGPKTAPLPLSASNASSSKPTARPQPTVIEPQAYLPTPTSLNGIQTQPSLTHPSQNKALKNSVSTPNLRIATSAPLSQHLPAKASPKTKTKDRWLAAETWCDALLFPRPRLRMKAPGGEDKASRIVSLPPSPVQRGHVALPGTPEEGVESRVLAHSRSLVDVGKSRVAPVEETSNKEPGPSSIPTGLQPMSGLPPPIQTSRAPRPKSWALDDLALPTPVPSLARVVEEGERFDDQRKKWQDQATSSFQNSLTRSISRSRSKSLSQKGRRNDENKPSNIKFLAARAYLGNQLLTPLVAEHNFLDAQIGKASHSHSNSLAKTWSKSSKSHSRGHSRSDSFGRGLLKKARPVVRDWTNDGEAATENELESALRGHDTKVIQLADPALARDPTPLTSNSPTPSGSLASDARIGIALTTPPLINNPIDIEGMRLPAHPYAQGGMFSFKPLHDETPDVEIPDYVIPNPSDHGEPDDTLVHDFSPHSNEGSTTVPYHPYAQQASSRSSFVRDTKFTYSDIPASSKMWAQLSPGVIREVLPGDLQYSPFMSENGDERDDASRKSRVITDMVGVGEALVYAVSPKASEAGGLHGAEEPGDSEAPTLAPKRSYRQLVQYDTTRPPHLLLYEKNRTTDPYSAHTFASSPLLQQQQFPALDIPRHDSYDLPSMRTISTSPENLTPPHSPRLFGDPDDLDGFYDLFYNPDRPPHRMTSEASYASTSSGTPHRGGSGLASLARQLNEEFGQMAMEQGDSQYSTDGLIQGSIARRPTGSTLEFVFEETSSPGSTTTGLSPPGRSTMSPFQPSSANIPEDVESSRASSPLEPHDDNPELRLGTVGSVSTPPVINGDPRSSYIGDMTSSLIDEAGHVDEEEQEQEIAAPQLRIMSVLQPPSADPTRSSYMTTSSMSRMSGLSDFPVPPPRNAVERHMSTLTSYFDEAHSLAEVDALRNDPPPQAQSNI
ncbi:hypothetical protein DXG01_010275 [Tephrocybe rancida]|nr:hypothetical protein DXG01_010275 [Tephrocybe rancida]